MILHQKDYFSRWTNKNNASDIENTYFFFLDYLNVFSKK